MTSSKLCRECGYDLRALPAGHCPECGKDFDPSNAWTFRKTRRKPSAVLVWTQLICALHPLIVLLVFYSLMFLAWIESGQLPNYGDDPSFYGLSIFLDLIVFSCMALPGTIALGFVLGLILMAADEAESRYLGVWRIVLLVVGWLVVLAVLRIDPGGCWNWFFD